MLLSLLTVLSLTSCTTGPQLLTVEQMLTFGGTAAELSKDDCNNVAHDFAFRRAQLSYSVGRLPIGTFSLFGERLGISLDMVNIPGNPRIGQLDQYFITPAFQLPEKWQWAMDTATYPVLIIGGAAILTTVIVQIATGAAKH